MQERPRHPLAAYGLALLATAVSLLVRWPLWPVLGNAVPQMTFFPAVMIAAYVGGFWPGIVTTLLSAVAANYFIAEQPPAFHLSRVNDVAALVLFILVGTIVSALCESLHRVRRHLLTEERRRAGQIVRETEERFRQIAENIHEIFWVTDVDHQRLLYVSPGYDEVWGRSRQSWYDQPQSWLESIHPDDRSAVIDNLEQRRKGVFNDLEFRILRPDGSIRWVRSRAFPIKDPDGRLARTAGLAEDITERKRAEAALRESEHRWRRLTEALPQLVWSATPDGSCDYFSTQWTAHTGVAQTELLGWRWLETLHPDDREPTRDRWLESLGGRHDYDVEYRIRHHDGEYRWFKTRGVPIHDSSGAIVRWFGTCTDITDLRKMDAELRQAKEAAEAANRAKDEFLANVSHEIRTPMNAILGMTELVLDTPLSDDQRQSLRTVKSAADNLLGIINDLLDFSKIEAGKLTLDPGDFSLRATVSDTMRALAVRAHRKGIELVCNVQPEVPDALIGDASRLRQVLLNLVGNAIKFTEKGEVVVQVEAAAPAGSTPERDASVRFSVRDTGIGISREKQSSIFRAFEQEDTSTTRKYGGTGLGLTISSRLVTLMGGNIEVESQPGHGSMFSFTALFGRQAHQPPAGARAASVSLRDLRVLVVDDNAVNRQIMEQWLREWKMEPTSVGDAMAAMDALWHGVAVRKPHALVLLDMRMPDTDGLALADRIRERTELSASRILLLTSGDRPADLARLRHPRLDGHLLKPVQRDELLETIYSIMRQANGAEVPLGTAEDAAHSTTRRDGAPLRILVAEDSEFNAQLMEKLLTKRGHAVRVVTNGREAIANAADCDLLLLDVHMPEMDGFQVIRSIRDQERVSGGHLPVIALTARSRKEDRELCLRAGMDEFLAKPIQALEVWAAIERVVSTPAPAERTTPGLVDSRVLLAACGGDAAILRGICDTLRARLPDYLAAVTGAFGDHDAPRLREAAHKLSGMVGAFSTAAGALASQLEDHAARGQLEEAAGLIEELNEISEKLPEAVSALSIEKLRFDTGNSADPDRS